MKRILSLILSLVMLMSLSAFADAQYADGTYEGAGAGLMGPIKVSVTVSDGKIADVTVLDHSETPGLSDPAVEAIPAAIIDAQSFHVDAITGATYTSDGIMKAVQNALEGDEETAEIPFEQADMIVIGAGMAGMTAAVRAAELGLNVILFEQTGSVGGSAMVAGGTLLGNNTRMQKEAGIEDSPELAFADFVRLGGAGTFNEEIAREFTYISGASVDWLDDMGCDFGDRVPYPGVYQPLNVDRNYSGKGGASAFIKTLNEELEEYLGKNAYLALNSKVTNLLTDDEGIVVGASVMMADGTQTDFYAAATAICTGGYGGSEELLMKYNFDNILTTSPSFVTGDGYVWLDDLGAAFTNMDFCTAYAGGIRMSDSFFEMGRFNVTNGALWIDVNGHRMADETGADSKVKSDSWSEAEQNIVYTVFSPEMLIADANVFTAGSSGREPAEFDAFSEMLIEKGHAFKADSVEELAQKAGLPVDAFVDTITTYNDGAASGKDAFGRTKQLVAMENGPFYAVETIPYVMITSGGPMMTKDCEVVRTDGTVIQGVYIAGEIVGMANVGGLNSIGGMGHGNCLAWGKQIAEVVHQKLAE